MDFLSAFFYLLYITNRQFLLLPLIDQSENQPTMPIDSIKLMDMAGFFLFFLIVNKSWK